MIKKILLNYLITIAIIHNISLANTVPDSYVIHKSEIEFSSPARLSDIFNLIDECHTFTIDGFNLQSANPGGRNYQNQDWILMVNESVINYTLFGQTNINLTGINSVQIDSIEVFPNASNADGNFSNQGIIKIHTKSDFIGIETIGQMVYGNQSAAILSILSLSYIV